MKDEKRSNGTISDNKRAIAPVVYNFLESYDLSGKTIVPFCTHGGSGLSNTESTIADITGGTMKDGFAIPGTTAQNDRDTARSKVTEWLKEGGFVE